MPGPASLDADRRNTRSIMLQRRRKRRWLATARRNTGWLTRGLTTSPPCIRRAQALEQEASGCVADEASGYAHGVFIQSFGMKTFDRSSLASIASAQFLQRRPQASEEIRHKGPGRQHCRLEASLMVVEK
mmetsp:Transcript_1807/g.4015  ORF Transcript_1807/g.4015 Transcript_1807/m.4015 type:complete len:130 (-) Transcript_1807:86-475(-)